MRILLAAAAVLTLAACNEAGTDATNDADATEEVAAEEATMAEEGTDEVDAAEGKTDQPDATEVPDQAAALEKAAPTDENWQQITITGFECGDNCYLIYTRGSSKDEESALCEARACTPWFEMQEMPQAMVGKRAQAVFSVGQQVDGSGNVMSDDFPSITRLKM